MATMTCRDYEADYLVQRVAGRSTAAAAVPFTVFLVSRAVAGSLDPHRPPVFHKVSALPPAPAPAPGAAAVRVRRHQTRPLGELRRFVLLVPGGSAEAPPEFVHLLPDARGGALHVVELEAPPAAAPVLVASDGDGGLVWALHRRLSRSAQEWVELGDWRPSGSGL